MKPSIETEAGTIDEAIDEALKALGATRDAVTVEILSDARRGLLGFGAQPAKVRVSLRAPTDAATSSGASPAAPTSPVADATSAEAVVARLLELMDFRATVTREPASEDGVVIRIETESGGLLIGKHGQTLDGLEYLVNRMIGRSAGVAHVVLDTENYRARRSESLVQMARSLAERVKQRRRPETMAPMSPRDRRAVHLALREDGAVTTKSIGDGPLRRVVIHPAGALGGVREPTPRGR